jgi:hypothetical protein
MSCSVRSTQIAVLDRAYTYVGRLKEMNNALGTTRSGV